MSYFSGFIYGSSSFFEPKTAREALAVTAIVVGCGVMTKQASAI